jgi:hypothetical protein
MNTIILREKLLEHTRDTIVQATVRQFTEKLHRLAQQYIPKALPHCARLRASTQPNPTHSE